MSGPATQTTVGVVPMSGTVKTRTKRSLSIVRPRGPCSRTHAPGLHKLGCRGPFVTRHHAGGVTNRIGQRWSCCARR